MSIKQAFIVIFSSFLGVLGGILFSYNFLPIESRQLKTTSIQHIDVNELIAEFIRNNPKEIIEAVTKYQTSGFYEDIELQAEVFTEELESLDGVSLIGNPEGTIRLVEFFDYQCPHCKANFPIIERLIAEEPSVVVLPKHLPILGDGGPNDMSLYAAKVAEAARMQGSFLEFHAKLMQRKTPLTEELIVASAHDLGLDLVKLLIDADSQEVTNTIARSITIAEETGLRRAGTPSYLIAGKAIIGAGENSYARLKNQIEIAKENQH